MLSDFDLRVYEKQYNCLKNHLRNFFTQGRKMREMMSYDKYNISTKLYQLYQRRGMEWHHRRMDSIQYSEWVFIQTQGNCLVSFDEEELVRLL